ncbi:uncharacterized protein BJ171DRAFT_519174 [Polychytrium aggregatum]|uniref:uncharacterized protein n=1 Tax=Polychytrium aggregatum TaxID=110093 RepID=UPI0022FEA1C3|nr:uncharacterized protein BJ171DRAFT_519174 [Polychytrium aggregatum]KAI9199204.1 hypothetical protein BJ171DRAFT_519174 [Polychytrium aggregatum]
MTVAAAKRLAHMPPLAPFALSDLMKQYELTANDAALLCEEGILQIQEHTYPQGRVQIAWRTTTMASAPEGATAVSPASRAPALHSPIKARPAGVSKHKAFKSPLKSTALDSPSANARVVSELRAASSPPRGSGLNTRILPVPTRPRLATDSTEPASPERSAQKQKQIIAIKQQIHELQAANKRLCIVYGYISNKESEILDALIFKWQKACRTALEDLRIKIGVVQIPSSAPAGRMPPTSIPTCLGAWPPGPGENESPERPRQQPTLQPTDSDAGMSLMEARMYTLKELAIQLHIDLTKVGGYDEDCDQFS